MNDFELALERSRRYAELARGLWRPQALTTGPFPKGKWCRSEACFAPTLGERSESGAAGGVRAVSDIQHEYDRLFSHRTTVLCPIYEVEYDRNRAVSQGPTLADIAGFYKAFGLEIAVNERPDHLALELEFMSVLAYKEALALQNNLFEQAEICRDAQKKFLAAHLGRWVKLFAEILVRESQLEFYTKLATELQDFIESECRTLEAHPEVIHTRVNVPESEVSCPIAR